MPSPPSTRALLGRSNGPRAGWLLASLELPFVVERLQAAAAAASSAAGPTVKETDA